MTEEEKKTLRAKLEEEKASLEKELADIGIEDKKTGDWEARPEIGENESDDNDLADRFEDFEERSATMNALEPELARVNDALAKMDRDDGSYGVCEVCHNPIEPERLAVNPSANTCVAHMTIEKSS